ASSHAQRDTITELTVRASEPRILLRLEFGPDAGGHYRRVQTLSRIRAFLITVIVPLLSVGSSMGALGAGFQAADARQQESASVSSIPDPEQIFRRGEEALRKGDHEQAEHNFKQVVVLNPQVAGAYANLGVIYMRRKQ